MRKALSQVPKSFLQGFRCDSDKTVTGEAADITRPKRGSSKQTSIIAPPAHREGRQVDRHGLLH